MFTIHASIDKEPRKVNAVWEFRIKVLSHSDINREYPVTIPLTITQHQHDEYISLLSAGSHICITLESHWDKSQIKRNPYRVVDIVASTGGFVYNHVIIHGHIYHWKTTIWNEETNEGITTCLVHSDNDQIYSCAFFTADRPTWTQLDRGYYQLTLMPRALPDYDEYGVRIEKKGDERTIYDKTFQMMIISQEKIRPLSNREEEMEMKEESLSDTLTRFMNSDKTPDDTEEDEEYSVEDVIKDCKPMSLPEEEFTKIDKLGELRQLLEVAEIAQRIEASDIRNKALDFVRLLLSRMVWQKE